MIEWKGKFFLMIYQLMTEYNPEAIEGRITTDPSTVAPEGWIDASEMVNVLNSLSTEAVEVIGKKAIGVINATTDILKGFTEPQKIVALLPLLFKESNRDKDGADIGGFEVIKNEKSFLVIKDTSPYPDGIARGLAWGLLEVLKRKVVSRKTINDDKGRRHEIKYVY